MSIRNSVILGTTLPHDPTLYPWDSHEYGEMVARPREYEFQTPTGIQEYEYELACAARAEGLSDDDIQTLLEVLWEDAENMECWRHHRTGRWQIVVDRQRLEMPWMWLPEWVAWYRAQHN